MCDNKNWDFERNDPRHSILWHMMKFAWSISHRSTCSRARVGTLLTDVSMGTILAYGYNGNARGFPNRCDEPDALGGCGCVHAEINALLKPRPRDNWIAMMISTHSPCPTCAKAIINAGIQEFHFLSWYRVTTALTMLHKADIATYRFDNITDNSLGIDSNNFEETVEADGMEVI